MKIANDNVLRQAYQVISGAGAVKFGEEIIAAIGVGGAPGENLDEIYAKAGLDKIKDRLK